MKFLLELMSCCGPNLRTSSSSSNKGEETRSLVIGCVPPTPPPPQGRAARIRGVKRGRSSGGRNGGSVGDWRPSLSSISEDNVLYERNQREQAALSGGGAGSPSSERNLKRKLASLKPRARSRSIGHDPGRPGIEAMFQANSPAPFMF